MRRRAPFIVGLLTAAAVPAWAQGLRLTGSALGQRVEYRMRYQGVVEQQTGTWVGGELRARLGPVVLRVGTVTGSLSGGTGVADVSRTVRSTLLEAGVQSGEWLQLLASGEARRFETDAGVTTWGLMGGTVRLTPELGFQGLRALAGASVYPVRKTSSGAEMQTAMRAEAGFVWAPNRSGLQASLVYRFDRYDFAASGASAPRLDQFRGVMLGVGLSVGSAGHPPRSTPRSNLSGVSAAPAAVRVAQAACRPGLELRVRPPNHTFTAVGGTLQLEAFGPVAAGAGPAGACSSCRWSSSDSITATVSSSGLVTARANGSATIAAWMPGGFCGRTTVTVAEPVVNLWAPMTTEHSRDWEGVWGTSSSDVYAVGRHQGYSAIMHWDGLHWQLQDTVVNVGLAGVWGAASDDVYAVGGWGSIRHLHEGSWATELELPAPLDFVDVWGSSPRDIYVVGSGGVSSGAIWRKRNATWTRDTTTVPQLQGVWGSDSANVIAVGAGNTVVRWNGTAWSRDTTPSGNWLHGVWGSSPLNVFAVGFGGTVLHSAGGRTWVRMESHTAESLMHVWGASAANVYAVGGCTIVHWDGRSWTVDEGLRISCVQTSQGLALEGIWGSSPADLYAAGIGGTVLHGVAGATVAVTPASVALSVGATRLLAATARDAGNNPVTGVTFVWSSSDNGVATVSATGMVAAVHSGTATIRATAPGGASGTATITVP